jgi:hypothetical protein
VTGTLGDQKGKIPTLSPVNSATIDAQAGAEVNINLPENHTAILYLLDGEIEIPRIWPQLKCIMPFYSKMTEIAFLSTLRKTPECSY